MPIRGESVAALHGVATVLPSLDFETFSAAGYDWDAQKRRLVSLTGMSDQKMGLKATGVRPYVEHATFRLLSLAYDLHDLFGPVAWWPGSNDCALDPLFAYVRSGGRMAVYNAEFEWTVWAYYCVPVLGWPAITLDQLDDTMAKAKRWGYPASLANLGSVLNLNTQKDKEGKRLLDKFSMPRNPTKADGRLVVLPSDEPAEFDKLVSYNLTDIAAEAEAAQRIPDLSERERATWLADQRINDRGVAVDVAGLEACISIVDQAHAKYNGELIAMTGCEASEVAKLQAWLGSQGVECFDLTDESVQHLLSKPIPPNAHRALQIRSMLGSASVKKLWAIRAQLSAAGRVHGLFSYAGARTLRWSGQGPQPQNLYSGAWHTPNEVSEALAVIATKSLAEVEAKYGNAIDVVNNVLRSLFVAAPGHVLLCSDYSAIEGVITAALAGEQWRMDVFNTHRKIYEASGAKIMGLPLQMLLDHKKTTGQHHPARKLGKFAELASGFGGWVGAWLNFGAGEFLSEDEIKKAILAWRAASPMIVELWGGQTRGRFDNARPECFGLEGAAVKAIKYAGAAFTYRDIAFQMSGSALYMRLPNGELRIYHEAHLRPSQRNYSHPWEYEIFFKGWNSNPLKGALGWVEMKLYGGLITENVVQSCAREIQAAAIVRLERAGYPIVLHTHDEIAAEVPMVEFGSGRKSLDQFEALMGEREDWFSGWPILASGGWANPFYGKFE